MQLLPTAGLGILAALTLLGAILMSLEKMLVHRERPISLGFGMQGSNWTHQFAYGRMCEMWFSSELALMVWKGPPRWRRLSLTWCNKAVSLLTTWLKHQSFFSLNGATGCTAWYLKMNSILRKWQQTTNEPCPSLNLLRGGGAQKIFLLWLCTKFGCPKFSILPF